MIPAKATPSRRTLAYLLLWIVFLSVVVARRSREVPVWVAPDARPVAPFTIDLNTDPAPRIALIPGIGPKHARTIVSGRPPGGYRRLDEVQRLPGVPDAPLSDARRWLVLSDLLDHPGPSSRYFGR